MTGEGVVVKDGKGYRKAKTSNLAITFSFMPIPPMPKFYERL